MTYIIIIPMTYRETCGSATEYSDKESLAFMTMSTTSSSVLYRDIILALESGHSSLLALSCYRLEQGKLDFLVLTKYLNIRTSWCKFHN